MSCSDEESSVAETIESTAIVKKLKRAMAIAAPTFDAETFRDNVREWFHNRYFCTDAQKGGKHAANLERGVFNWTIKESGIHKLVKRWDNPYFKDLYVTRLRMITTNLNQSECESIRALLQNVINRTIKVHSIAFMTHMELRPDLWDERLQKKFLRDKNLSETTTISNTSDYKCGKCKQRNCFYYALQTRSSDEPMTVYVRCLTEKCGARWKTT
jgi:DNA-directed RNA polymerase subunit M/transcription elongation factor TFIIS